MKVGFVVRKGNFEVSPSLIGRGGYSVQRLTSVLYERLLKNADEEISIDKVIMGTGESTSAQRATMIGNLLYRNLSKYDILHANAPLPLKPLRIGKNAKLVETSHGIRSTDREKACYCVEPKSRNIYEGIVNKIVERHVLSLDYIIE